jgi:hypothetical protein
VFTQQLHNGGENALTAFLNLVTQYSTTTLPTCKTYIGELEIFLYTHANFTYQGENVIQVNWDTYAPEIIQQYAHVIDQINEGNYYQAGQLEAQIFQILIGTYQPTVLPSPQFNYSNYVQFNVSTFLTEFYTANLKVWGVTNPTDVNNVIDCANQFYNLSQSWAALEQQAGDASDFHEKVPYIKEGFADLIDVWVGCSGAWEVYQEINADLWDQFEANPVGTILRIAYNVAENLPEIVYDSQQMGVYDIQGEYDLAGELDANMTQLILNGLYTELSDS